MHARSECLTEDNAKIMSKNYITFPEACEYLGLSAHYLYKLVGRRRIPHYKPNGKKLFFSVEELDAWIAAGRVATSEELETAASKYDAKRRA